jgi:ABC-2 type transport system ATP-binding protein
VKATTAAAVSVEGLTKRYDDVQAVDGVDFDVRKGEVFGFLGPNGAGKTTTINILTGLARPDAGAIRFFDRDVTANIKKAQHQMGVVPDESNLWPELTGFENLCFCAALYGMVRREREARARDLLAAFGLDAAADRRFGGYSKGMQRKLTIAAGIIHRPAVLFLDEPTTGIDVASAREIRRMLGDLNRAGATIFLTTHYIEEAERLCDRIAFIVAGRLVRIDTVANLVRDVQGRRVVQLALSGDASPLLEELRRTFAGVAFDALGGSALRAQSERALPLAPLVRFFEEHGVDVTEAKAIRPSLEDVFVRITGVALEQLRKEKGGRKGKGGGA